MNIQIVSSSHMIADLLMSICEGNDKTISGTFDSVNDIRELGDDSLVILHDSSDIASVKSSVATLRQVSPGACIALLTPPRLAAAAERELRQEVQGILSEEGSAALLLSAIDVLSQGYRVMPSLLTAQERPAEQPKVVSIGSRHPKPADPPRLSKRERDIMVMLSRGMTNKKIAIDLGITEATVKVHLRACYRKINVHNRTQAAIWAVGRL